MKAIRCAPNTGRSDFRPLDVGAAFGVGAAHPFTPARARGASSLASTEWDLEVHGLGDILDRVESGRMSRSCRRTAVTELAPSLRWGTIR